MTKEESSQLTEVSNDIKWIIKSIEEMNKNLKEDITHVIESQNGKNLMTDNRITEVCGEVKCVKDKQDDMEIKQAVSTSKLTAIVGIVTFVLTMVAQALFTTITEMLKK
jgi:hypothetical protein